MTITSLNSGRLFALTLTPKELSIVISALDCVVTQVEASGIIPETLVGAEARNQPDPTEDDLMRATNEARGMKDKMVGCLPGWKEL